MTKDPANKERSIQEQEIIDFALRSLHTLYLKKATERHQKKPRLSIHPQAQALEPGDLTVKADGHTFMYLGQADQTYAGALASTPFVEQPQESHLHVVPPVYEQSGEVEAPVVTTYQRERRDTPPYFFGVAPEGIGIPQSAAAEESFEDLRISIAPPAPLGEDSGIEHIAGSIEEHNAEILRALEADLKMRDAALLSEFADEWRACNFGDPEERRALLEKYAPINQRDVLADAVREYTKTQK